MQLVAPSIEGLGPYSAALERGFCPDNMRGPDATVAVLAELESSPVAYLATLTVVAEESQPRSRLGEAAQPRLRKFTRWMWDGDFAGVIELRWIPGTTDLPEHTLGHIGFSVVPWRRGRGYATKAVAAILREAEATGLPYVDVTVHPDNRASQRVIEKNGGRLIGQFTFPASYGRDAMQVLRFRMAVLP